MKILILCFIVLIFLTGCLYSKNVDASYVDFGDLVSFFYERFDAPDQIYLPLYPNHRRILIWKKIGLVIIFDYDEKVGWSWWPAQYFNQKEYDERIKQIYLEYAEDIQKKQRRFMPNILDKNI